MTNYILESNINISRNNFLFTRIYGFEMLHDISIQLNGDVMLLMPIGDVKQSNIRYRYEDILRMTHERTNMKSKILSNKNFENALMIKTQKHENHNINYRVLQYNRFNHFKNLLC